MAQHIYSLDCQGNPVYVESADPQSTYFCPDCKGEMIVKNQGAIREHHFAHKNIDNHIGYGESETHSDAVLWLQETLRALLNKGNSFKQIKTCPEPNSRGYNKYEEIPYGISNTDPYKLKIKAVGGTFVYDILENIDRVEREYTVKAPDGSLFRPDLALLQGNRLVRAVEVVYSHEDSPEKARYYKENMIDVVRVDIQSSEEILALKGESDADLKLKTIIYVNNALPIRTTKEMLVQNLRIRQRNHILNSLVTEMEECKNEAIKLKRDFGELYADYIKFLKEISNEKSVLEENLKSIFESFINESSQIILEIESLSSELDWLYNEYTVLINDIKAEKDAALKRKDPAFIKQVKDSHIFQALFDYASTHELSAFDNPAYFARQILPDESFFLKMKVITDFIKSDIIIMDKEKWIIRDLEK